MTRDNVDIITLQALLDRPLGDALLIPKSIVLTSDCFNALVLKAEEAWECPAALILCARHYNDIVRHWTTLNLVLSTGRLVDRKADIVVGIPHTIIYPDHDRYIAADILTSALEKQLKSSINQEEAKKEKRKIELNL